MEAGAVPRVAPPRLPALTPRLLRLASDGRLVGLVREGRSDAFETVYDRHHRGILCFCRHLLGDQQEAEDAVQHTFMAAYTALTGSRQSINLRPWLFTIARNRCYSVLRARREQPMAEIDEPASGATTEGLAAEVQRRQDLRDIVRDLRRLPDEQRAALVLAELESLSHAEIAEILDVPRDKVKALVFQARESLLASRTARDTACHEIRRQLAVGHGGALRRGNLRRHLRDCEGCRAYRSELQHQRKKLHMLLPIAPTLLAKEGLIAAAVGAGGAATVGGSGVIAVSALKTGALKSMVAVLLAGAGTVGTIAISTSSLPVRALVHDSAGRSNHRAGAGSAHVSRQATLTPAGGNGGLAVSAGAGGLSAAGSATAGAGSTRSDAAGRGDARHSRAAGSGRAGDKRSTAADPLSTGHQRTQSTGVAGAPSGGTSPEVADGGAGAEPTGQDGTVSGGTSAGRVTIAGGGPQQGQAGIAGSDGTRPDWAGLTGSGGARPSWAGVTGSSGARSSWAGVTRSGGARSSWAGVTGSAGARARSAGVADARPALSQGRHASVSAAAPNAWSDRHATSGRAWHASASPSGAVRWSEHGGEAPRRSHR